MVDERFRLRTTYVTPETLEMARVELNETPENTEKAISELRTLLHEATDLHYRDDDEFLTIVLRCCHWYPKSALEKLRSIAEFRKTYKKLVWNLTPEDEEKPFTEHDTVNILANCDQKGRRVLIVRVGGCWDTTAVTPDALFRIFYLIHIGAQLEPEGQIRGVVVIMDFDKLSMKQVRALSPSFSKLLLTFIQDAMPLRLKEVHIVKQPFIFKLVWPLFKQFIREKLNKRIHFHGGDMKSLHKFLSPEVLPKEYGGELCDIDYSGKEWIATIQEHRQFVEQWGQFGYANQA